MSNDKDEELFMYCIELRDKQTKEWGVYQQGEAKSRRAFLKLEDRGRILRNKRAQWRCTKVADV